MTLAFSMTGCSLLSKLLPGGNNSNSSNSSQQSSSGSSQSGSQSGSSSQGGGGGLANPIEINLDVVNIVTESVYPTDATNFTVGGQSFVATNGVGKVSASYNAGLASFKCMQFNKAYDSAKSRDRGAITNSSALSLTKIEVVWYATFSPEETQYFPVMKGGASSSSLVSIACDQTTSLDGENTGVQDGGHDVYKYETSYTVPSGNTFFSFEGASGSASYIAKITLK